MAKDPSPQEIAPSGKLFIDSAAELRSTLVKAFAKTEGNVLFRWDGVEEVDLPLVQLLYAARLEAGRRGREFHFSGILRDRVATRLLSAGFVASLPLSGEELEAGLVDF